MRKFTLAICTVLAFSVPATAKTLTGAELQEKLVGKRIKFENTDGTIKGTTRYNKNGKARVSLTKPNRFKDKGIWWIKGNKLCNQWEQIREGEPKCFTYKELGPKTYGGRDFVLKTN